MDGKLLTWVSSFKYLGSMFHDTCSLDIELSRRIQLAAHAFRRLRHAFFRQRCIRLQVRMQVYHCMVTSVLLYGCEAWALSAVQLERLEVFHRQCLRQIVGWRLSDRMSNEQLCGRCNATTMRVMVVRHQLRWLGHLGRMGNGRLARQCLHITMAADGRRRRPGRRLHDLSMQYEDLAQRFRACLPRGTPRGTTWLDMCVNRAQYRELCRSL